MEFLPLTVCPSQLQLHSTDDQSLAAIEARLLQGFFDEGIITDMSSLDTCPFPTIIPDPAPPSPSPSSEVAPASEDPQLDEDFFADLLSSSSSSTDPQPPFNYEDDLPTDFSAALLASWDDAAAATANEHQPALRAAATSTTNYEALSYPGAVPIPVAVGQAPVTPESSTRRSSDDGFGEAAPCGWGWDPVSAPAPAPVPGSRPGYMTPPGSSGRAMTMETAMAMDVEEIDWEALLALCAPAPPPPPPPSAAPTFFPAPAPAPVPTLTLISPPLTSTTTTTAPSRTKSAKAKTQASERRERKVTRRRREPTKAGAPGTFVFAENIVPPPEVYVSAYTHTREYCLDARGKLLKRRRYEDGK